MLRTLKGTPFHQVCLESVILFLEVLVISGDFNFHMDDPFDNDAEKFGDLLDTFGLIQHVSFTTHTSGHWLDLIQVSRSSNDIMVRSTHPTLILANHQLKLNDEKTEFLMIESRQRLSKVNFSAIHVGASEIKSVGSVRNLGPWFDSSMSMSTHVGKVCSKAFRGLYSIP